EAGEAKRPRFLAFKENFKKTFKLFAEVYGVACPTNFRTSGFQALCGTFASRDRVIHPKSFNTFLITDEETKRAGVAMQWLYEELTGLLHTCSRDLDKRVPHQ